jgi:hypothetical protein
MGQVVSPDVSRARTETLPIGTRACTLRRGICRVGTGSFGVFCDICREGRLAMRTAACAFLIGCGIFAT